MTSWQEYYNYLGNQLSQVCRDVRELNSNVISMNANITSIKKQLANKLDRYEFTNLRDGITGQNFKSSDSTKIELLERRIEQLEEIVANQQKIIYTLKAAPVAQVESAEKKPVTRWIWEFNILETRQIFLNGSPERILGRLRQAAAGCEELTDSLETLNLSEDKSLAENLRRYKADLQKLIETGAKKFPQIDEDILSGKASEAFFDVVKKNLLNTVVISIYRCPENRREVYREFLRAFNEYLKSCGIYTKYFAPGKKVDNEIRGFSDSVITKGTANPNEDNDIYEIERLPYFLNYCDENNSTVALCCGAKIFVRKYNGRNF